MLILFIILVIIQNNSDVTALTLNPIDNTDNPGKELIDALISSESGIIVIRDSVEFVGSVGNSVNQDIAQSATYTNFELSSANPNMLPINNQDGILLTTGNANLPFNNTNAEFGLSICEGYYSIYEAVGLVEPIALASFVDPNQDPQFYVDRYYDEPEYQEFFDENYSIHSCSDEDLVEILNGADYYEPIFDVNSVSFDFTVKPGLNIVEADFIFGSDEFPEHEVTDIFAFIIDGENFAYFPDGSLISFVKDNNEKYFNDNPTESYGLEYDGISNTLHISGKLDEARTVHTLKIAIADTSDQIIDSGIFIGNFRATPGDNVILGIDISDESASAKTQPTEKLEPSVSSDDIGFFDSTQNQLIVGGGTVAAISGIAIAIKTGIIGTKTSAAVSSTVSSSSSGSSSSSSSEAQSKAEPSKNSADELNLSVDIEISGGIE